MKGRAAEGATRSDTEDQGAGQGGTAWGRAAGQTAEGAGRSNKKKKKTTRRVKEEPKDTSSESSDTEEEQEVNRVIQERVWPGTSTTARRRDVRLIRMESGDESTSNYESNTEEEQDEEDQANRERVWPGTRG